MSVRIIHGDCREVLPTQKPLGIVEPLLRYACPVGGSVLDLFAGSGTTAIAAKRHGCNATLIEARADFVSVAEARIESDAPLFAEVSP